ncbi:MAG: hypothetical protein ACWGOY_13620, partial [Anaerolineales bacterium]
MSFIKKHSLHNSAHILVAVLISALILVFLFAGSEVFASSPLIPEQENSSLHPTFPLLDEQGENVLDSGEPVSTLNTCGACHDTDFISTHSFHADVGLGDFSPTGGVPGGRSWDTSPGLFGRWDPLTYRYLSMEGDQRIDLTTPGWLQEVGVRHVGGGPATTSQDGTPLVDLVP